MPRNCCVPGCDLPKSNFHVFPVFEEEMFKIWVARVAHPNFNSNISDLHIRNNYRVCDGHFIPECKVPGSRRLKYYSLPSIKLPGFLEEPSVENSFFVAPGIQKNKSTVEGFSDKASAAEGLLNDHCYIHDPTSTFKDVNHRFPKPDVRLDMYNTWLEIINDENLLKLDPFVVYRNKRICSAHFDPKYLSSSNCLYKHAVPISPFIGAPCEPQPSTSQQTNIDKHVLKTADSKKESTEKLLEGMTHHRFPNPDIYLENFHRWIDVLNIPKFKEMTPHKVHKNYRVCFAHFDPKFKSPGCRLLHRNAYPTLNLPEIQKNNSATTTSETSIQIEPGKKTKTVRCIHTECITNTLPNNEKGSMFSLPLNKELRTKWLMRLNRPDLMNLTHVQLYDRGNRVCSRHFTDKQFQNYKKLKLNRVSVPMSVLDDDDDVDADQPETGVKRSATTTEEEIPSKQAKINEEINVNQQTQDLITIEENPIAIQEEPVDDEVKISETIRRLELVRKQRQNTSSNRKPTMSEEMGSILHKAVVLDLKKCYNESLVYYQKGIEMLCNALKSETNESKKEYLKNKIKEYLGRAEKIKELLKQQAKYHEQITIENNSTGHSYEKLFKKYLDIDVETVKIEDPYIRLFHQCQNFLMFCELLVKSCVNLKKIYLITSLSLNHTECVDQQQWLNDIKASLLTYKIQLDITYSSTLHDRQILLSNGWIIKIGRGLDFFKKSPGKFCIGNSDYDLRLCCETSIDIFHQENVKQSFG